MILFFVGKCKCECKEKERLKKWVVRFFLSITRIPPKFTLFI